MMKQFKHALVLAVALTSISSSTESSVSAVEPPAGKPVSHEPNWTYGVVRVGESRDAIKSMPSPNGPIGHSMCMATPCAACTIEALPYQHREMSSAPELQPFCASDNLPGAVQPDYSATTQLLHRGWRVACSSAAH